MPRAASPLGALASGYACAGVVVALDQISKWWIRDRVLGYPRRIEITDFFNLVYGWNRGVSFGLFNTDSPWRSWVLAGLAALISVGLSVWMARTRHLTIQLTLGLIIGGAIGNLIDRVRFGAVFDFLDFHVLGYHWPAFNVADSAISIGAVLLIIDSLFFTANGPKK